MKKIILVFLLLFVFVSCSQVVKERNDNWYLVEQYPDIWSISIRDTELDNVESIEIKLRKNDYVVDYNFGFTSRIILELVNDSKTKRNYLDFNQFVGEDMVGTININKSRIIGDELNYNFSFEGEMSEILIIIILDREITDLEFNDWKENNYLEYTLKESEGE